MERLPTGLVLEFTKMHGTGNDFVVIDNRFYHFSRAELTLLARRLCQRRFGVGADGLLALADASDSRNHARMDYYNADGSSGAFCGNGARCLARFGAESGLESKDLLIESESGVYRAELLGGSSIVRVYVRRPSGYRSGLATFEIGGGSFCVHAVEVGVPHVVALVDDVAQIAVDTIGYEIRGAELLQPEGANVNFVSLGEPQGMNRSTLVVRTFERGVEKETLACGSGAIASAFVAQAQQWINTSEVTIRALGGDLVVGLEPQAENGGVYLQGGAETVFRGSVTL